MQTDSALGKRFSASGRDELCNPKIFFFHSVWRRFKNRLSYSAGGDSYVEELNQVKSVPPPLCPAGPPVWQQRAELPQYSVNFIYYISNRVVFATFTRSSDGTNGDKSYLIRSSKFYLQFYYFWPSCYWTAILVFIYLQSCWAAENPKPF